MELTDEQLKTAETQLKDLFPQSQQIYGYIALRNRVRSDPIHVLVDSWPEYNVILCKPQFKKRGDQFKDICVFSKDEASLKGVLEKKHVIDWTKYLCLGTDMCFEDMVWEVASEKQLSGTKVAACHMMTLQDVSSLPPVDSSTISIASLDESHIELINSFWKFGDKEHSVRMIQNMILHFPSCCVLDSEGQPVSWILTYASCALGMLYTLPEHRGKGYAKALVSSMAKKLFAQGYPVYCFIEEENTLSYRLFKNMGFTEDSSYRAAWFVFNSL